jgi:hypothetical protein
MEIAYEKKLIIHSFIQSFTSFAKTTSCLLLSHSEYKIYEDCGIPNITTQSYSDPFPKAENFDLILGDFPFGLRESKGIRSNDVTFYSARNLLASLQYMSNVGFGIYALEPILMSGTESKKLRWLIEDAGFSIAGIINSPAKFLGSYTSLQPLFLIISKPHFPAAFLGDLQTADQATKLAHSFFNQVSGQNLLDGLWISPDQFEGFEKWEIAHQIKALNSEYKNFKTYTLRDIALAINLCRTGETHIDCQNCIYIPKIGTQDVISDISLTAIKHQNYIQVACDPSIVSADYLAVFFQSDLGRLTRKSLGTDSWIKTINKSAIENASIPIPALKVQEQIVSSLQKLKSISNRVLSFEESLAKNPISSTKVLSQIDKVLDAVGELADTDRISSLIREGESKSVEFKETFSLDVNKQTKENYIRASSIKTIAAFLNSDGGVLLIGVNDAGVITGLDTEVQKFHKADNIHKSRDRFLLDFKNALKHHIGEQFYTFINHRLVSVDSQIVLFVECKASPMAVYVDNKDFFVRTNPSTDQLEGPKLVAYIQNHFKS